MGLSDFFDDLLDHQAIAEANIGRIHLDMVVAADGGDLDVSTFDLAKGTQIS